MAVKKKMHRSSKKKNVEQKIPVPNDSMLHKPPTNLLLLTVKQEPHNNKKSLPVVGVDRNMADC